MLGKVKTTPVTIVHDQNFLVGVKVEVDIFAEVVKVGISNVIQIPENLQQIQRFLEQCLSSDSPHADFIESLVTLAQFKGESLEIVKQKVIAACEKLAVVDNLQSQSDKHANQCMRFLQSLEKIRSEAGFKDPNFYSSSQNADAISFEEEMVELLSHNHFEAACQRNLALSEYLDFYWDYSFDTTQEYLLARFQFDSLIKNYNFDNEELNQAYQVSFSLVETAVAKILNSNSFTPKLRLPESFSKKSEPTTSSTKNLPKDTLERYTLEQLLENVTPDNYHEETDWGEVVGNEIW